MHTPDAIVLGGGGTLGIAWLRGMAAGLLDAGVDLRQAEYFVGTSAGAVISAHLAAGRIDDASRAPATTRDDGEHPPPERRRARAAASALLRAGATAATPFTPYAFALGRPGGAALRAAALATGPKPTRSLEGLRGLLDELGAEFDGRLRVTAVDKRTGRRVVFGEPGAPAASVTDAVLASCAVPWIFRPVTIGGREYVDGGAWSPSNLDVVPAGRGAEILALLPVAGGRARSRLLTTLRVGALAAARAEAQLLRARGARVQIIQPDERAFAAIGPDYFDERREGGVMTAGIEQGRALGRGAPR